MFKTGIKKIFIVTGELSGDRIGAWYLKRLQAEGQQLQVEAVGGDYLAAAGAQIYLRFEKFNLVGLGEIIKALPSVIRYLFELRNYIVDNNFDEVVLVDYPGFNLQLAKLLKKKKPSLIIIYVSPPQLWCWGAWRVKRLKAVTDSLVVMYPFEVVWYAQRGISARFIGNPVFEAMADYQALAADKQPYIALIPGSRHGEIERLLPIFLQTAQAVKKQFPEVSFILPLAGSVARELLEQVAAGCGAAEFLTTIRIITDNTEKYQALAHCALALSKPGTVTLELAFLQVPTIIAYKTSALTYWLAKRLATVSSMGLPNLLLDKEIFREYIQSECTVEQLIEGVAELYQGFAATNNQRYTSALNNCKAVCMLFEHK
jgi:lipid-A-disaccharide synthase